MPYDKQTPFQLIIRGHRKPFRIAVVRDQYTAAPAFRVGAEIERNVTTTAPTFTVETP